MSAAEVVESGASAERFLAWLGTAFDEAPVGIALLDADLRYTAVNPEMCRILGRQGEALVGRAYSEFTHPEDLPASDQVHRLLAAGRLRSHRVEQRLVRPDGTTVTCLSTRTVVQAVVGRPAGYLVQLVDITAAKDAEDRLRISERRHRALVAHSAEAMLLVDPQGFITYASPAVGPAFGYSPDELVGRQALDFIHPDDVHQALVDLASRMAHSGPGLPSNYRVRHADGTWRWGEAIGTGLLDDPDVGAVVVNLRDVTDARLAQDALAASEARLRSLVANVWDVIAVVEPDGRVGYVSPSVTPTLGWLPDELVGRSAFDLVHPDDRAEAQAFAAGAGRGETVQLHLATASGEWKWMELAGNSRREDPAVQGFVVTARDVTERQAASEALGRRAAQQGVVAALSNRALRDDSLPRVLDEVVSRVGRTLSARHAWVLNIHEDGTVGAAASWSSGPERVAPRVDSPTVAHQAVRAWTRAVVDYADRPDLAPLGSGAPAAGAAIPVGGDARRLGVLVVEADAFDDDDVAFLEGVANIVAVAGERNAAQEELRRQATEDPLTGLPNRAYMLARVEEALARTDRRGPAAVLLVDCDEFKTINDSLGHAVGDDVVVTVSRRLRAAVRPGDMVARLGGDEFVVLCEAVDEATATAVAERLGRAVAQPMTCAGYRLNITASVGVCLTGPDVRTASELLSGADAALYEAKGAGRNRHAVFDADMRRRATRRLTVLSGLEEAIDAGRIRTVYQPVVDLTSGARHGAEALVRWDHPSQGTLAPGVFVPVAEETGLIDRLGAVVLDQAVRQAAVWEAAGRPLRVAVNIAVRQLAAPGFVDAVRRCLAEAGVAPHRLLLEVTETAIMRDLDVTLPVLLSLRDCGVGLAVDDFGTGYSSLSYLERLPVDYVKLDRSFVARLPVAARTFAVVAGVVSVARALGLATVAEGVETAEQLACVEQLGFDYAQGFLWGVPGPAATI